MSTQFNPLQVTDAYKLDHRRQYPRTTSRVYSNLTARGSRIEGVDYAIFFGLQAFLHQFLGEDMKRWFHTPRGKVISDYQTLLDNVLGPNDIGTDHIGALHDLGYVPLEFRALPEGTKVPIKVPMLTVENTHKDFFWLTNYFETALSSALWLPITSATKAYHLRELLDARAKESGDEAFVDFQGHDFSMRGMSSFESGAASGAGHLLSFLGTDTLSALEWIRQHYETDGPAANGFIGGSVAATEHSVMCVDGMDGELGTFERLMSLYPTGIVSVVSDTWDLWHVLKNTLPLIKDDIMARDGKLVIRPDSGNPADILCGTSKVSVHTGQFDAQGHSAAQKGVIELLWEVFGGTTNEKGYKVLDPHIGAIYGDSITYEIADEITSRLMAKGFASTNVVLGVGSYTYQYATRDTLQMAMKATWAEVGGEGRNLFKDPVTDSGMKKSATGRLAVKRDAQGDLVLHQKATEADEAESLLQPVWRDGKFLRGQSFADIRKVLARA